MSFLSDVLKLGAASPTKTLLAAITPSSVTHTPTTPVMVAVTLNRGGNVNGNVSVGGVIVMSIQPTNPVETDSFRFFAAANIPFTVSGTGGGAGGAGANFIVSIQQVN